MPNTDQKKPEKLNNVVIGLAAFSEGCRFHHHSAIMAKADVTQKTSAKPEQGRGRLDLGHGAEGRRNRSQRQTKLLPLP
jgi:hypothetical protein